MRTSAMSFAEWALPAMPYLTVLPLILPAAAAGLIFLLRGVNLQRAVALTTLAALTVISAAMIVVADTHGIQTVQMGGWDAPVGITMVADRLSSIMLFVSSIVLFAVMWYGISQGLRDGDEDDPVAVFLPTYMLLTLGVNLSFLAGDLFNLYVGFEVFLVASYVLLTLGASPQRVRAGIGYLSEDRKHFGLALGMDVRANVAMASLRRYTDRLGQIDEGKLGEVAREYISTLRIRTPSDRQEVRLLSGGNQQKVVIAKWLLRDCDILIFDEPTRGIDVGAKAEIYRLLQDLAAAGKAIIVISSELPEVLRLSHRIAVMCEGRLTGFLPGGSGTTQEEIMRLATLRPTVGEAHA